MTQFHEGQEVEIAPLSEMFGAWRKAKIVMGDGSKRFYRVEFSESERAVFSTDHIRETNQRNSMKARKWK